MNVVERLGVPSEAAVVPTTTAEQSTELPLTGVKTTPSEPTPVQVNRELSELYDITPQGPGVWTYDHK